MKKLIFFLLVGLVHYQAVAQCLSGNCYEGIGTYLYNSGAKYVGQFKEGKIDGEGTLYFSNGDVYKGQWNEWFREGKGKLNYINGDVYTGDFMRSKRVGFGRLDYNNGDTYEGNFEKNVPQGFGVYLFTNGNKYEGTFFAGLFSGYGEMSYQTGEIFKGEWTQGEKHGSGIMILKDGTEQPQNWNNGRLDGSSSTGAAWEDIAEYESDGDYPNCNGQFCDNIIGILNYRDGSKYVGEFKNGNAEGTGTVYYGDGKKYVGGWRYHSPHGKGIFHYEDGRRFAAIWRLGEPIEIIDLEAYDYDQPLITIDDDPKVKVWAVIVGVGDYKHMTPLSFTDDDAYKVFDFLKSPEGGAVPEDHITLLVDKDATKNNIINAMQTTFLKADANDVVMMYFSGHGVDGAFIPFDFDGYNNQLYHKDVLGVINKSKAKHKICFADACHSGSMFRAKSVDTDSDIANRFYNAFESSRGGTALMMSSRSEETSLESHGLRQGVFSHFLMKGLKGIADKDEDGVVTVVELFDYVKKEVVSYTVSLQTPVIKGDYANDMPLSIVRKF